jgi:formylglycine-generating enzyme required for sulfatase activity
MSPNDSLAWKDDPSDESLDLAPILPEMVTIPAGQFWMGSSDDAIKYLIEKEDWATEWFNSDMFLMEQPVHPVTLPDFQIAKSPVTNAEYNVFVFNTGYRVPKSWQGFHFSEGYEMHPVTGISKSDAEAYIQWLNKISANHYRLPSEAEWEKSARGLDQRIYPWGDNFDPWRCNTIESGKKQTSPVGSYSPGGDSQYHIADMIGNVWEWTRSILMPYPYKVDDGRETPASPTQKCVVRGGAWYYSRALARCSSREGVLKDYTSPALGFRLARS